MDLNVQIKFSTESCAWLCFRHAVEHANAGENVDVELDDFEGRYYMGTTVCQDCVDEEVKNEALPEDKS